MENSKNAQTRTILLILGIILVALCLCTCLAAVLGLGFFWIKDVNLAPTSSPASMEDTNQQMDEIQQQAAQLRGLSPTNEVTRTLINSDQLRQNVTADFLSDYSSEEAQDDALVLSAFGLLEPDFDLLDLYLELYSEQIAGYYDNETKEMYVVQDSGFNGPERLTYAHEFTHVLQDQVYDIQDGLDFNDEACEDDSERCLGIQALLEGDASLLELQWFEQYATSLDRSQVLNYTAETQSPVYDSAPSFLKEDFLFPYTWGYTFVEHLYEQGGWESIDQAYVLPPISSEQILHPEAYPSEIPLDVTLPDFTAYLGTDWAELEHGVVGEWYTYLILAYGSDSNGRIEDPQAQEAAAGWGGDAYIVYKHLNNESLVMSLVTKWDTERDAQEYEQAFLIYLNGRFGQENASIWEGPNGAHRFARIGNRTIWLLAQDTEMANTLWNLLASP